MLHAYLLVVKNSGGIVLHLEVTSFTTGFTIDRAISVTSGFETLAKGVKNVTFLLEHLGVRDKAGQS